MEPPGWAIVLLGARVMIASTAVHDIAASSHCSPAAQGSLPCRHAPATHVSTPLQNTPSSQSASVVHIHGSHSSGMPLKFKSSLVPMAMSIASSIPLALQSSSTGVTSKSVGLIAHELPDETKQCGSSPDRPTAKYHGTGAW